MWESSGENARKKTWRPFGDEHQALLQHAWAAGVPEIFFDVEGYPYSVCLQRGMLKQTNLDTGYVRYVRAWLDEDEYVE